MSSKPVIPKNRTTMRQVAEHAGVSTMTVSNVLRGREAVVLPDTRAKVLEAARILDYMPVHSAKQNRHHETRVIALSLGPPSEINWSVNAGTYNGMCDAALRHGYDLMTLLRPGPKWAAGRDEVMYLDRRSDGLIFAAPIHEEKADTLLALVQHGIPVVVCYRRDVPAGVAWVDPDNDGIVHDAVAHLAALGHRKIVHLTDGQAMFDKAERSRMFVAEMARRGLEGTIVEAGYGETDVDFPSQAFAKVRATGATAVFALNDKLALELCAEAERQGVRVPEHLSVIGVDNEPRSEERGLTTMAFSYADVGRLAVEALVGILRGGEPSSQFRVVPISLVRRATTGPAP